MSELVSRRNVMVNLPDGLHVRPLGLIARVARQYPCDVRIYKSEMGVDAKNVMEALTLNAPHGTSLVVEANGEGADEVVERLVRLFETDFEEEPSAEGR